MPGAAEELPVWRPICTALLYSAPLTSPSCAVAPTLTLEQQQVPPASSAADSSHAHGVLLLGHSCSSRPLWGSPLSADLGFPVQRQVSHPNGPTSTSGTNSPDLQLS